MNQQRWTLVMRQALLASAGVVLLTVWWVSERFVVEILLLMPVAVAIGWLLGVERLWPLWQRVGLVAVGSLVALLVAATGGGDSAYQDLFLVVIIGAALAADEPRDFIGGVIVAVLGAAVPALYDEVGRAFVADTVADALVWTAVGVVTWRVEQGRTQQGRDRDALLQRFVTVAEDERERLADDLHDEAIQLLAAARLRMQAASKEEGSPNVDAAHELLGEGLLSLRRLILELKSPDVSTGSLEDLVHAYAARLLSPADVAFDLHIVRSEDLHHDVVTAAYRIIVEALANVVRHADARRVSVTVEVEDGSLVGRVRDDGCGLPDDMGTRPGHIGLRSMRERAEVLGGSAGPRSLAVADAGGTEVVFTLPLQPGRR